MEKNALSATKWAGWFARPVSRVDAECLLFALPYGGAGAGAFQGWPAALPCGLEVEAVRLPGREQRLAEPHSLDPDLIAAAVAARADRPYAIYGHSLGARLGFEVIRSLRRRRGRQPVRFYAAAARPPDVVDQLAAQVGLDDEKFLALLDDRIPGRSELLDEPELRELLLPVLRADFEWLRGYRYRDEPPLDIPITVLAGDADRECGPADMAGWERHTSAPFQQLTIRGGHFFPLTAADRLASVFATDLLGGPGPVSAAVTAAARETVAR